MRRQSSSWSGRSSSSQVHLTAEERKALDAKEQERNRQWEQRLAEQSEVSKQESLRRWPAPMGCLKRTQKSESGRHWKGPVSS